MLAVGFWSAHLGGSAVTRLPLAFLVALIAGMGLGLAGVVLPTVEAGIVASILLIGLVLLFSLRLPVYLGVPLVGLFAVFHGHAHGWEMPGSASALWFALGAVMTTAALIYTGIGAGRCFRAWIGERALSLAGALTVSGGLLLLA
jgi:urease accessory protein